MTKTLDRIKACLEQEQQVFEAFLKEYLVSEIELVNSVSEYLLQASGKRIRSMLVLLTAGLCGKITPLTYRGTLLIELFHTATLVHDDIVDESFLRRGQASINTIWNNKTALWYGDYLFSKSLLLMLEEEQYQILGYLTQAAENMSVGELIQLSKSQKLDITEETYFQIITQKTATLFKTSCQIGAYSAQADEKEIEMIANLGLKLGLMFQLKDDLIDYYDSKLTGKPQSNDLKQRKITLPLIYSLASATPPEKRKILGFLKSKVLKEEQIQTIVTFIRTKKGFEYVHALIDKFMQEIQSIIAQFPPNQYRQALSDLALFIVEREK